MYTLNVHIYRIYIYIHETNEMYDSNASWHLTFLDSSTNIDWVFPQYMPLTSCVLSSNGGVSTIHGAI